MTEKPIPFTGEMVRAILDGRKTMTRRVIKPQPGDDIDELHGGSLTSRAPYALTNDDGVEVGYGFQSDDRVWRCPYGQPGSTLWVREATRSAVWSDGTVRAMYDADTNWVTDLYTPCHWFGQRNYKPARFMPRAWCRLRLDVVAVRVKRVQNITTADIRAEGVDDGRTNPAMGVRHDNSMRIAWQELWDTLNAKRGYPWSDNPWVWVIEFRRLP